MLQKKTVEPSTLDLITRLQKHPALQDFLLVGDTALALQIGHRKSIDIDLFTEKTFSALDIYEDLSQVTDQRLSDMVKSPEAIFGPLYHP